MAWNYVSGMWEGSYMWWGLYKICFWSQPYRLCLYKEITFLAVLDSTRHVSGNQSGDRESCLSAGEPFGARLS
jgi:hypothetical protein